MTPASPLSQSASNIKSASDRLHAVARLRKSGFDSPDRFASRCEAPPPITQRHLVDAFAAADIEEKEYERGERDDIRSGSNAHRVDRHNMLSERKEASPSAVVKKPEVNLKLHRSHKDRRPSSAVSAQAQRHEGKANAFAFFGHVRLVIIWHIRFG